MIHEPVRHAGGVQLALELSDHRISVHLKRDVAMKTAACSELLGMKERRVLKERERIAVRHLEKRVAIP